MGSCVSKKAARGAGSGREVKVAAPLPPVKEINALSPVAEEEEEVKEVVLSERPAPRLPRSPPEPSVTKRRELSEEEEAGSGSESASVGSAAKEKEKATAGGELEVVKRAVPDAPEKARARGTASPSRVVDTSESKLNPKPKQSAAGNVRARSPSPSSAHRRQPVVQQQPMRQRREPAVVSAFGCRSGRFSPSAARRAAESAVRRTHSARDADMALPAKRALLGASINGDASTLGRRDLGERSGRRADSPTGSRCPSPNPSPVHHRQASASRRAAAGREHSSSTPERPRPRRVCRDVGPDDAAGRGGNGQLPSTTTFAGGAAGGGGEQKRKPGEGPALGQNPSVAMECFIFL